LGGYRFHQKLILSVELYAKSKPNSGLIAKLICIFVDLEKRGDRTWLSAQASLSGSFVIFSFVFNKLSHKRF
jgi:hypothetical protein